MAAIQKPSLALFTGDKTLGTVFSEQNQIMVKYMEVNAVGSDSTGRLGFNAFGKTRILILQGAHDGTGFTGADANLRLMDFIEEMEDWVNYAGFTPTTTFTNSFNVSFTVQPVDWTWTRSIEDPYRILYTLLMKEVAGV